jgi:hypothetical protein
MAERSPSAARADHAKHIALVCKYIRLQGPSFEPIAIERHARAAGFEFLLGPTDADARGDDAARDDARATYERARDEAIRAHEAARRRADAAIERGVKEEMTRGGARDGDAEAVVASFTGRGSDDGAEGMTIEDAMDAVVRAREIAERLFASAPTEGRDGETATRETETVVVDFEKNGETTTKNANDLVDGDDDDAMDFNALVEGFVREEEEADEDEDEDERRTAPAAGGATTTATAAEANEGARANQVEEAAPGAGDHVEEPALDLTMMFPSSKRKPMGDLAGFDQVMKVKKPRQKRKPKPKYDPTPSLLDDDLVAIAPAVKDVVDDFIAEDDYDNIEVPQDVGEVEEDDEIAETDVEEDSPQVTEVRAEFLFPSSVPKKKTIEKEEETFGAAEEEVTQTQRATNEETEAVAPTEDVAMTNEEDNEEVTQPEVEVKHASTDDETSIAHWNSESNSPGDAVDMPAPVPAPATSTHAALPGKVLEKIAPTTIPNDPACLSAEATLGKQTLTCSYCHTYEAVKSVGFYAHERACKKRLEKEKNTLTCPHCQVYASAKGAGFAAHERACKRKHEQGTFSPVVVQPVQVTEKVLKRCVFCNVYEYEGFGGAGYAAHKRACQKKHEMDVKTITCFYCGIFTGAPGDGFAAHERACKKKRESAQLPTSTSLPSSPPAPRTQPPPSSTPAKEPITCSYCRTFTGAPGAGFAAHERACKKKRESAQLPTSTSLPSSPPAPRTQPPPSSTPAKEPITCSYCRTFTGAPGAGFAAHERACKKKRDMDAKMLTCSFCQVYKSMKGAGFAAHERACKKKCEGAQLPTSTLLPSSPPPPKPEMVESNPDPVVDSNVRAALLQKQSAPESGPDLASAVSPAECSKNTMPSKAKLPKVAADTLLAQRVLHFIKTTLSVQDLTKSQLRTIVRKSMVKVMTVIPRKFDQNTEQGTSAFLTDSRKQKINALLDQYVARLKAKANSKNSTPMTATPTTPTTPTV